MHNDVLTPSSTEDIQDSQSTEVSGEILLSQQSSVATRKETAESELQGTSRSSELKIQIASPQEIHDSQCSHSGGFDELAISKQSPEIQMASPGESQEDQIVHSEVSRFQLRTFYALAKLRYPTKASLLSNSNSCAHVLFNGNKSLWGRGPMKTDFAISKLIFCL